MLWHYLIHRAALRRRPPAARHAGDGAGPLETDRVNPRVGADRVIAVIFVVVLVASLVIAWASTGAPEPGVSTPPP